MDAAIVETQQVPAREVIRDRRGFIVGTIERQRNAGKLIARNRHGIVVGAYDEHSQTTRNARGQLIGRANLLPALLFQGR